MWINQKSMEKWTNWFEKMNHIIHRSILATAAEDEIQFHSCKPRTEPETRIVEG